MTTLSMRYMRGDFVVTGPDIEPLKFKSRREAKDCAPSIIPVHPLRSSVPMWPDERPKPRYGRQNDAS
jgi:hypothetical protein